MFFYLSKTIGLLAQPLNLALALGAVWALLRWRKRAPRMRRWIARFTVALPIFFSLPLVAQALLWPLESAYPQAPMLHRAPVAIAMLTGMTEVRDEGYELTGAADRIVESVRLAHRYPSARLLLLGGTGSMVERYQESAVLGAIAAQLGISERRIVIDVRSRNTHENAEEGAKLLARLGTNDGDVLLVTSALHMTRAVACFSKSYKGPLKIVPWPVDYQRDAIRHSSFIPRIRGLARSTRALNEYIGMFVYWLSGYL